MSDFPIAIDGGFNQGEVLLERLDITEHQAMSRKTQGKLIFLLILIVSGIFIAAAMYPVDVFGWLPLIVILTVLFRVMGGSLAVMFAPCTEIAITNQRLLLRSGVLFVPWVVNYRNEIEVLVLEESSSFAIRPRSIRRTPKQVYCKAISPFQRGKYVAELLRAQNAAYLSQPSFNQASDDQALLVSQINERGVASGAIERPPALISSSSSSSSSLKIPPGILVTHSFLLNQLFTLVAAIPSPPELPSKGPANLASMQKKFS
ncbi:hypothetical protein BH11CYA1_BH11CYA1_00530 [soil metagenome]